MDVGGEKGSTNLGSPCFFIQLLPDSHLSHGHTVTRVAHASMSRDLDSPLVGITITKNSGLICDSYTTSTLLYRDPLSRQLLHRRK